MRTVWTVTTALETVRTERQTALETVRTEQLTALETELTVRKQETPEAWLETKSRVLWF